MYRFEKCAVTLYREKFYRQPFDEEIEFNRILCNFEPWETEEMACVYDFLEAYYTLLLVELGKDYKGKEKSSTFITKLSCAYENHSTYAFGSFLRHPFRHSHG